MTTELVHAVTVIELVTSVLKYLWLRKTDYCCCKNTVLSLKVVSFILCVDLFDLSESYSKDIKLGFIGIVES